MVEIIFNNIKLVGITMSHLVSKRVVSSLVNKEGCLFMWEPMPFDKCVVLVKPENKKALEEVYQDALMDDLAVNT
jgi:hypothetical protein